MSSVNMITTYSLSKRRTLGEHKKHKDRPMVMSTIDNKACHCGDQMMLFPHGKPELTLIVNSSALLKAVKNAMNTNKGAIRVENKVLTYLKTGLTYEEFRGGEFVADHENSLHVNSTEYCAFIEFRIQKNYFQIKGDDAIIAIQNIQRI